MEEFNSNVEVETLHFGKPRTIPQQREIFLSNYNFEEAFCAEHKEIFTFNFPTQLKLYINIGYFLFLVPYQISFDGHCYVIKTSLLHKVVCGCVYFCISIYHLCDLIRIFTSNMTKPADIFYIASHITFSIQSIVSLNSFWRKMNELLAIANIPRRLPSRKVYFAAVTLSAVSFCFGVYNQQLLLGQVTKEEQFRKVAGKYYGKYFFQNKTLSQADMKTEVYAFTIVASILETFSVVFTIYAEAISLLAALAVHEIMSRFRAFLLSSTKWDQNILKCFNTSVLFAKTIDGFHSPIYVWTFANIITYMSSNLILIFNSNDTGARVFIFIAVVYYVFMLCCAAEAYDMSRTCKQLMLDLYFKDEKQQGNHYFNTTNVVWQLEHQKIGLRGGPFFITTYPFIGATISAVLTYVLVMMQFQMSSTCNCTLQQNKSFT